MTNKPFFEQTSLTVQTANYQNFNSWAIKNQENVNKDINKALKQTKEPTTGTIKSTETFLYHCLILSGGIYAFFASFDGMFTVLLTLFPFLHISLMLSFALIAALCGLGVFLARDRISIAEAFDIEEVAAKQLTDHYLFSLERYYDEQFKTSLNNTENLEIIDNIAPLKLLKTILEDKSKNNQEIMNHPVSAVQTQLVVCIGAVLFFSDGFFIGESLAALISSLLVQANFWTLLLSILIGLMALSAYWYVERPYVEKYLLRDLLTDESKVEASLGRINEQLQFLEKLDFAKNPDSAFMRSLLTS